MATARRAGRERAVARYTLDTVRAGLATPEAARTLAKEVERLRAVIGLAEILVTALDNAGRLHAIDGGPELAAAIRRG